MRRDCKRIFAGILAATMMLNGVFVSDTRASAGGASGGGALEGTLADVFNVVLPTQPDRVINQNTLYRDIYDFILDPLGLAASGTLNGWLLEPGASVFFQNAEAGAAYEYSSTSDALTVINKSTAKVDVKLDTMLAGMDGVQLVSDRTFVNEKSPSVYLAMIDGNSKSSVIDKFGAAIKTTLDGRPEAYNVIYNTAIGKYQYRMKDDTTTIDFPQYSFRLNGACNSAGNWLDLGNSLNPQLTVVWSVALRPKHVAPSIAKTAYVMSRGRAIAVDVDLGSGKSAATGIKSVTYKDSTGKKVSLTNSQCSFANHTLTFSASFVTALVGEKIDSRSFTVTFDDEAETTVAVILATNDVAPFIAQTEYVMAKDEAILVDVELGSGAMKASGIKAIKYTNKSGASSTLSTDYYTFEDGVLRLKKSYINNLLAGGTTSRDYIIVFNDKAATQAVIKLAAEGTSPSIAQTAYQVAKNKDVTVNVDLGGGSLAATGIASIKYVNKSGATATLATDNYTYSGGKLTINASYINSLIAGGLTSRNYTVKFDNVAGTEVVVTLTADDEAPSIGKTAYTMAKDEAITVDVNLGSGSLGATDIKAIKYVNKSGAQTTLAADYYTFTDGVLRLKKSYINSLLAGGTTSRVYTVVFNDQASTQIDLSLTADGTVPTISQTTYKVAENSNLSINVNLGSGALAADGIKSITYVSKSTGTTTVLTADRFSFSGRTLTINAAYINSLIAGGLTSRDYTITFNNVCETKVTVALTADSVAPSIAKSSYTMVKDQAIEVNVNLGSGSLRANGIHVIKYTNKSGVKTTLSTDYYTFENGVLRLKKSYINSLVAGTTTSRDYTITFDNSAATKAVFTLKK